MYHLYSVSFGGGNNREGRAMAIKRTQKYLEACRWIAGHYDLSFASVLSQQTPHDLIYTEMRVHKMAWSSARGQWVNAVEVRLAVQSKTGGKKSASIRVTTYNDVPFSVAIADLLADFVQNLGGTVNRTSRAIPNSNNDGARVYLEVEI